MMALGIILVPMVLIVCQKETGSALVYLSFFLVLYREGMTGAVLFSGICAVVYFIVGIRFSEVMMPDECTSWGDFSVMTLIVIFSALLVKAYGKNYSRAFGLYPAGRPWYHIAGSSVLVVRNSLRRGCPAGVCLSGIVHLLGLSLPEGKTPELICISCFLPWVL